MRIAGAPPGPEGYQVTSLIKSIESRLRDSATGDSQHVVRPRSDPEKASEAATARDFSGKDAVDVNTEAMDKGQSDMGSKLGGHIGGNESDSIVSLPKLNISLSHSKPEHDEAAIQPNSDRLSSIDKETEDILIVLSVDDERHQQLEDTALLWQVRSLPALLLHNMAWIERHMSLTLHKEHHQPWSQTPPSCMCSWHAWDSQTAVSGHTLETSEICG